MDVSSARITILASPARNQGVLAELSHFLRNIVVQKGTTRTIDSIRSIIAVSYYSQDSSEDDAFVVWNRSSPVGPDMFVVLPRCGLQSISADASVCDNSTSEQVTCGRVQVKRP